MVYITISVLVVIVGVIVLVLFFTAKSISKELSNHKEVSSFTFDLNEKLTTINQVKNIILISATIFIVGFSIYFLIRDTPMQGFVMEWLNLLLRWVHVVAGIMWIGASFYFIFLENNLNRTDGVRDELAGNLWAIHGGGFYFLEKYKVAPKQIPKNLHWFKYEAYFTWLSGIALLFIVYYMDARAFLIDPQVADISVGSAILIGILSMVVGWIIYDGMCKSRLVKRKLLFVLTGIIVLAIFAYFLALVFSSRAAYIHLGALIGTLMAWNVYFVIIPSQKALVKAAILGEKLNPELGRKAGERSLHNNYFTLPVIFIMISNHFPSTYGQEYNWIVLMVIVLASMGIKHFWNLFERGEKSRYILPVSIIAILSLALVTSPLFDQADPNARKVSFQQVQDIVVSRCIQCHSTNPTDEQWQIAPNKVMFDTPDQIKTLAERIMIRTVNTKTMPLANKTQMTDEERELIKAWIMQGANID